MRGFRKAGFVLLVAISGCVLASNNAGMSHDPADHSAHMAMMQNKHVRVSESHYEVPDVNLLNRKNQSVDLKELLQSDKPVLLNFIFTSCKTICPVISNSVVQLQHALDEEDPLVYVSVSIDPQYDRPARLMQYAEKFHAGDNWQFLTGTDEAILKVTQAFAAYNGSKMNHKPLTLFKLPKSNAWLRVEGLASGHELAKIYKQAL